MAKDSQKLKDTLANGLAGILGSSTGKICLHPIDTVKAKL
jgi:hypothetical protein